MGEISKVYSNACIHILNLILQVRERETEPLKPKAISQRDGWLCQPLTQPFPGAWLTSSHSSAGIQSSHNSSAGRRQRPLSSRAFTLHFP